MGRTLVAGFGNVLRGDDGFGVAVVRALEQHERATSPDVVLLEVGTGGIHLAQELLSGYDRLIIVDAMARGGQPGSVYVVEIDDIEAVDRIDMHLAIPSRALSVAKALGSLPSRVFLVGCEPATIDELSLELSEPVRDAIDGAIRHIEALMALDGVRQ